MSKLLSALSSKGEKMKDFRNWISRKMLFLFFFATPFNPSGLLAQTITVDGNPIDWASGNFNLFATKKYVADPKGNGVVDNQFTEGSKDFLLAADLAWVIGQTKAKNDIANAAAVIKDGILYFAGDRTSNNGDAQIGFWLYLNGTGPVTQSNGTRNFAPPHVDGDVLMLADFTGGGRNGTVTIYQWYTGANPLPAGTSIVPNTNGNLRTSTLTGTVAENNDTQYPIPLGWDFINPIYDYNEFYEGQVSLTGLGLNPAQLCLASFLLETRSSQSITASLDDFAHGSFNITPPPLVLTGSIFCASAPNTGTITSITSQDGGSYQLYNGANQPVQGIKTGTGSGLTWSDLPAGNGYYVVGIGSLPICTSTSNIIDITSQPATTATDLTGATRCVSGADVVFTTTAGGTGPFTYVWKKDNVVIVGASTNSYTVAGPITLAQAGTYSVEVTGTCGTVTKSAVLTVNANPVVADQSVCVGSTVDMGPDGTWSSSNTAVATINATTGVVTGVAPGTSTITYTNANGCTDQAIVTVNANPECSITGGPTGGGGLCVSQSGLPQPTYIYSGPAGMSSYSWSISGPGVIEGSTTNQTVVVKPTAGGTIVLSLQITNENNCTSNCSKDIPVIGQGPCLITGPDKVCASSVGNVYDGGAGAVAYSWTIEGNGTIVGSSTNQTVTVTAGAVGTYKLTLQLTNPNLCVSICEFEVTVEACGGYCTYTQGKYSNTSPACDGDGVNGNGPALTYQTVLDMIKAMLGVGGVPNPLVIGGNGKFVTIPATASGATLLHASMPGGGTATELFGSCTVDNVPSLPACWTPAANKDAVTYITKLGRINNVLLSQTITLGLNMRVSSGLSNFAIQAGTFATAGRNGGCGSTVPLVRSCYYNELLQLVVVNEYTYKTIPASVITALNNKGYPHTVGGLYQLANDALGNVDGTIDYEGGAKLSNINDAVSRINEGFDECRIFVGWDVAPCTAPVLPSRIITGAPGVVDGTTVTAGSTGKLNVTTYPNPFNDQLNFRFVSPVSGKATLEVFNVYGQRLSIVFDGEVKAGIQNFVKFHREIPVNGMIIYKLTVGGQVLTGKVQSLH